MERPPLIEVEVIPPPRPGAAESASAGPRPQASAGGQPGEPFHPLSAALLLVIDNLWMIPEFAVIDWILTVPLCFLSVVASTWWIQRQRVGDRRSVALAKALFLGVIAAVPFSVTGTPIGLALLAWAGIRRLQR